MEQSKSFLDYRDKLNVAPVSAGVHLKNHIEKQKIGANEVSKKLNCGISEINDLLAGGVLTIPMAVNIEREFNLDAEMMFNLEAMCNTYKAKQKLTIEL